MPLPPTADPAPPAWLRWLPRAIVFLIFLASHVDRLYLWGDDFNNLSPRRPYPLPDPGAYIGGRVVDGFFNGLCYETFATFVAPVLGLEHVVDIHSAHGTFMFALTATVIAWLGFAYARLFVQLGDWTFVPFALSLYVFVIRHLGTDSVTSISAYVVPLALALTLLLPFIQLAVLDEDPLARRTPWIRSAGIALLTYLVAFSLTNVALFASLVVAGSLLVTVAARVRASARGPGADGGIPARLKPSDTRRAGSWGSPRGIWKAIQGLPDWTRLVAVLLPLMALASAWFDVNSERFSDEQSQALSDGASQSVTLAGGLTALVTRDGRVLGSILLLAGLAGAGWLIHALRRLEGKVLFSRLSRLAAILVPATALYALFLLWLSRVGGKDYFAKEGISTCLTVALALPLVTTLFALGRTRAFAIPAAFAIFTVSFTGLRQLEQTPARDMTKAEVKGILDSLYMSYSHGEPRVPVVLRHADLGWPHAPKEEDWYFDTFWRMFLEQVVGHGAPIEIGYKPHFERVQTVDELYAFVEELKASRPLLIMGAEKSPYWINVPARPPVRADLAHPR